MSRFLLPACARPRQQVGFLRKVVPCSVLSRHLLVDFSDLRCVPGALSGVLGDQQQVPQLPDRSPQQRLMRGRVPYRQVRQQLRQHVQAVLEQVPELLRSFRKLVLLLQTRLLLFVFRIRVRPTVPTRLHRLGQ